MAYIPQTADAFPLTLLIAILAISGGALVPVSYTHLDVYKRQLHRLGR